MAPSRPRAKGGAVLLFVVLIAQLMVILDITAVNIALPSLAKDLQLSGSSISWTITSYSLIFGSLLLFGGRAADLLGRRRMFLTGLGIFTASSFASATAGTATALFAARAGQGLGAALLSPAALAIIMTAFQGNQRAKALAAWGAVGGAGAAIGVLVGGLLTEFADWRMIFYVNLPVAAALAIAALKIVPADTQKPRWRGLDLRGAVLATIMSTGSILDRLLTFCNAIVGRFRGGLAQVNVLQAIVLASMSGSALADAAASGKLMQTMMTKDGKYPPAFAAALTCVSSVIGPIIPPSIPLVIYALISDTSIGYLFLGGVIPGLLLAAVQSGLIAAVAKRRNFPVEKRCRCAICRASPGRRCPR